MPQSSSQMLGEELEIQGKKEVCDLNISALSIDKNLYVMVH
jgi:hypothetical protein